MATTLPRNMVRAEIVQSTMVSSVDKAGKADMNTRNKAANPAALAPTDMKADTADGAP